jgi:hypothetical protein
MDKPTLTIDSEGVKTWTLPNGRLHREDGPAIEYPDGSCWWYYDGQFHRVGGPATYSSHDTYESWCQHGNYHSEDGPAVIHINGDKHWYLYGKLHREDGPAIEDGKYKSWYLNGKRIDCTTQEEFERLMRLKAFW